MSSISKFINSNNGSILISIILGLGLASIFRRVCKDGRCIVFKGPPIEETKKYYYKIGDECYKYSPYIVPCESKKELVQLKDPLDT